MCRAQHTKSRQLSRVIALFLVIVGITRVAEASDWRDSLSFTLSERIRGEFVDWFQPSVATSARRAHRYDFFASQLRLGARLTFPHFQFMVELQDTRLVNLPRHASLAPPIGNLGPGANYFVHTRTTSHGETFLKQAYLTFRHSGFAMTVGRFEYSDGVETIPADSTLGWLKRARLGERLIGPFGYTHVTRSFDGTRLAYDQPHWNVTAFAFHPTAGGFEVSANRELDRISLTGISLTVKQLTNALPTDLRVFYLYYEDRRRDPLKVDNRPRPVRLSDKEPIAIHTWGGHAITAIGLGPGTFDALVWTAFQAGEWGKLNHLAWAYAVECGYQLPRLPWAPWVRLGYNRSSGDDDNTDSEHATFFQMLPTARIYAQFPFYNLMNSEDLFVQLIVKPHDRVTVRSDYHWLRVTERRDLWYAGGGATSNTVFGFSGIAAGNRRELAHLVDLGITIKLHDRLTAYVYYGHAFGQGVARNTFSGSDANYGYVDVTFRY
ncbi:MAG: hypothetical protein FJ147_24790 [Deltaproteobacteria bacterium]|nr:hypothetical protein [Deltaproteobacteria bacterium]